MTHTTTVGITTLLAMTMAIADLSAQQGPTTGYAPVNGLRMYHEVHGQGDPVVLLHGAFMSITSNWTGWIDELSKTRKVIAVEMQGHGRTAGIPRAFSSANHADDVAALLSSISGSLAQISSATAWWRRRHADGGPTPRSRTKGGGHFIHLPA